MSEHFLGSPPAGRSSDAILIEPQGFDPARRNGGHQNAEQTDALAQFEREQLARDIADIERATATLQRGEPALESWTRPAALAASKPRPLWLLIGVLWLSTALITAGAVVAIASFAG
jgi:hypothetical protein